MQNEEINKRIEYLKSELESTDNPEYKAELQAELRLEYDDKEL